MTTSEKPKFQPELGTVIAERILNLDGKEAVTVRIGAPAPFPPDTFRYFYCPFQIKGIMGREQIRYAAGVDTVGALEGAMQMIGALLYTSEEFNADRLTWFTLRDLGFPVPYSILDVLPDWKDGEAKFGNLRIRPARPEDYTRIADLTVAAYDALEETHSYAHEEYIGMLRDVAGRAKDADVIVAVDENDRVLGAVTLVLDTSSPLAEWDEPNTAGFRMLAVAPELQHLGIGSVLVEYCIARAREAGAKALLIHTRDVMKSARKIYELRGFVRHPEIDFEVEEIKLEGFRLAL